MPNPAAGGSPPWPGTYFYQVDTMPGGVASPGHSVICAAGDGFVAHSAGSSATCP
ncbi:MAG: hypothetical protein ACRELS_07035 [Candidatus Rokuibacteriota bacterium]